MPTCKLTKKPLFFHTSSFTYFAFIFLEYIEAATGGVL